ncbi:MAG: hypothetical protein KDB73_18620 [Planctomycetes bacterium]|nr:hypothetical protein [Planctomycetota bacterium]
MQPRSVLLLTLALLGCADPIRTPPPPASIAVNYGPSEIAIPGQTFDTIEVRLFDEQGRSAVGWPVTWQGDGEVTPLDSVTDGVGIARARWTLPQTAVFFNGATDGPIGTFTLHAEAAGAGRVTMSTTATPFEVDSAVAGFRFACGWRGTGVWCWGWPRVLGLETNLPYRVELPNGSRITEATGTSDNYCVADASGLPWCNAPGDASVFAPVSGAPPLMDLTSGDFRGCGLSKLDHTPWCWTAFFSDTPPVAEREIDIPLTALAMGFRFGCGLQADGAAWCWGRNNYGQLGIGNAAPAVGAQQVVGDLRFVSIAAGSAVACGATAAGAVWCWGGYPVQGRLVTEPTLVDDRPGILHQLVVGKNDEVYVLRDAEVRIVRTPLDDYLTARYFAGRRVRQLSVDYESLCMVLESGQVYCSVSTFGGYRTDQFYPELVGPVPDPRAFRERGPAPSRR